jgi:hypothetical protein
MPSHTLVILCHPLGDADTGHTSPSWPVMTLDSPSWRPPLQTTDWMQNLFSDQVPAYGDARVQSPLGLSQSPPSDVQSSPSKVQSPHSCELGLQSPPLSDEGANGDHWGPVYGEDEDMLIAIRDSLRDGGTEMDTTPAVCAREATAGPSCLDLQHMPKQDYATSGGHMTTCDHATGRREVLVTGHHGRLQASRSPGHQLVAMVGASPTHSLTRQPMPHFTGARMLGRPNSTSATPSVEPPTRAPLQLGDSVTGGIESVPPHLQLLLEGSNV